MFVVIVNKDALIQEKLEKTYGLQKLSTLRNKVYRNTFLLIFMLTIKM